MIDMTQFQITFETINILNHTVNTRYCNFSIFMERATAVMTKGKSTSSTPYYWHMCWHRAIRGLTLLPELDMARTA